MSVIDVMVVHLIVEIFLDQSGGMIDRKCHPESQGASVAKTCFDNQQMILIC